MSAEPLLRVRGLRVSYPGGGAAVRAVDGVDLDLARGETLGLVGESGCGKSTLVRALVGLERADAGSADFAGRDLLALGRRAWRPLRREIQLVFQDPYASLDPRMRVGSIVGEPLAVHEGLRGARAADRVAGLLARVRLDAALAARYPHELSGGQRQRVGLARALALEPTLLLLDEPVSALDVSVQAQILELLVELRASLGLTMLLIAHHLAVVRRLAQRVAVMFAGRIVEEAPRDALFGDPLHPYTRLLLESAPDPDPRRRPVAPGAAVERDVPAGPGCPLRNRCPLAVSRCAGETPRLEAHGAGRRVACHRAGEGGGPRPGVGLKPASRDGR